ncbi:MAG: hypothetical protein JW885_02780 [Deltaproteobacteria bacterium]|nr:hypothetical protein [Candidatus Zymogenaceae bacterium]
MAISVEVVLGDGTRRMHSITDALIANEDVAFRRGLAELRSQWYVAVTRTLEVPFAAADTEGDAVEINNPRIGVTANGVIRRVTKTITQSSRTMTVDVESSRRFE